MLKKDFVRIIICVALLIFFTVVNYNNILTYYNSYLEAPGIVDEDLKKEVQKENNQAAQDEMEYQNLVNHQQDGEEKDTSEESGTSDKNKNSNKNLSLHSHGALLLDGSNNRVLYEENGYAEMAMASTTKIMTCIVALENSSPDEVVKVSSYASKMPDVQLNIRAGEKYYLKDLLYSLMLESHNDVAVAIAEHIGGSVEGFAAMMNDKARSLGCTNTNFITPNGLDAEHHYTTPYDLAVIASYAIKNPKFIEITNTPTYEFKEIDNGRSFRVSNKNRFLYMMDGAIGVKTGFTGDAGYCFVGAIKRPDRTLISVVLGCGWPPNKSLKWHDTKELMNYGIKNFKTKHIDEKINLNPILVIKGQKQVEKLEYDGSISLLMRDDETIKIKYEIPKKIKAPVKAKSIVGYANYYINDRLFTKIPIYATEDIDRIDFKFCIKKLFDIWSLRYE